MCWKCTNEMYLPLIVGTEAVPAGHRCSPLCRYLVERCNVSRSLHCPPLRIFHVFVASFFVCFCFCCVFFHVFSPYPSMNLAFSSFLAVCHVWNCTRGRRWCCQRNFQGMPRHWRWYLGISEYSDGKVSRGELRLRCWVKFLEEHRQELNNLDIDSFRVECLDVKDRFSNNLKFDHLTVVFRSDWNESCFEENYFAYI